MTAKSMSPTRGSSKSDRNRIRATTAMLGDRIFLVGCRAVVAFLFCKMFGDDSKINVADAGIEQVRSESHPCHDSNARRQNIPGRVSRRCSVSLLQDVRR